MNDFNVNEIVLSPAASRLAVRYYGSFVAKDFADPLSAHQLWYAAVSAAECLQFTHQDIAELRSMGADREQILRAKKTGIADAHFYLGLVRQWLIEAEVAERRSSACAAAH